MKAILRICMTAGSAMAIAWSAAAMAHCDTLDGPVVGDARKALDTGDVKLVLPWVRAVDETEIRQAFGKARNVRKAGGDAKDLADRYFFETLVRVHRAGEGAAYTGLKAAGHVEPPVAAADAAIARGDLAALRKLVATRTDRGLQGHFDAVMAKKKYDPADVKAARAYSSAYVEFVHYAERLYDAAETLAPEAHAAPAGHAH